jgi:mannose-6-phosphate isomerase-like protein (cupin superfamily)
MNKTQKPNSLYYKGDYKTDKKHRGWFIGPFLEDGNPCKTNLLEIIYKEHTAGSEVEHHYHEKKDEILILLEGKAEYKLNDDPVIIHAGEFIYIHPGVKISGVFLEASKIIAIHAPAIPGDKQIVRD